MLVSQGNQRAHDMIEIFKMLKIRQDQSLILGQEIKKDEGELTALAEPLKKSGNAPTPTEKQRLIQLVQSINIKKVQLRTFETQIAELAN